VINILWWRNFIQTQKKWVQQSLPNDKKW
jgi:hypothetical protein